MPQKKARAVQWRRQAVAAVVVVMATISSARLFFNEGRDDVRNAEAVQTTEVAGRLQPLLPDELAIVNPAPEPITVSVTLDRSAPTISSLQDAGLDQATAQRWALLIKQTGRIATFQNGHSLTLYKDPATGDLRGLKYNLDDRVAMREVTYGAGVIRASPELIRYDFQPVAVSFRSSGNFRRDALNNALPRTVVETLDYAFHDHQPLSSLPRGSDIKLIYQEKISRDGSARYVSGLQAAEIRCGRKTLTAVAFRDESGKPRLYDATGEVLGEQALRYPLNFDYISSGFSLYRYHSILHQYRPHVGVDLVARYGTPVKAVADGRIETAGWCGGLGRCVRIQHEGGIVTTYGHLSQISAGLSEGTSVRVGEVIGRVGSTGLSTGPHLHYALEKDGRYVNPLTATIGENHPISPRMRALFDRFRMHYVAVFKRLPTLSNHLTVSRTVPSISAEPAPEVTAIVAKDNGGARRKL